MLCRMIARTLETIAAAIELAPYIARKVRLDYIHFTTPRARRVNRSRGR